MEGYYGYMLIAALLSIVGMVISQRLKRKFNKYGRIPLRSGMTGQEVAASMLRHYGISDVNIVQGQGFLTDHYNPASKTVSLSPTVYSGRNIAAAAVAAHECGHAVQHARSYTMLKVRSALVPVVQFSAMAQQWLLIAALVFAPQLLLLTIIVFAATTLFSLITVPVEFDASRRALAWLDSSGVTRGSEYEGAKDALWWAAMTYVAAALSALIVLLYLVFRFMGND
jgi:Zn-dependent membrane protease YugP